VDGSAVDDAPRHSDGSPRAMPPPRARFGLTESVVHPRIEFWPDPQTRALLNPRIAKRYSNSHAA
jgi:hypothetical protein